jgi:hypothetical protein
MKKPRVLQYLYAKIAGYFWLPCPLCGRNFGGHEWKSENTLKYENGYGKGVCPDCGTRAKELNKLNSKGTVEITEDGWLRNV